MSYVIGNRNSNTALSTPKDNISYSNDLIRNIDSKSGEVANKLTNYAACNGAQ